jgi:hypothetical protein
LSGSAKQQEKRTCSIHAAQYSAAQHSAMQRRTREVVGHDWEVTGGGPRQAAVSGGATLQVNSDL